MPLPPRRPLTFLVIVMVVDSMGWGIILPVLPQLIVEVTGESLGRASVIGGWLLVVYAGMQFVFAPVLGNLSDRVGRRPVLLVSLTLFSVNYLVMGLATSLAWLFAGRILTGLSASTFGAANAYVADISAPAERAKNFGKLGAAFGIGFVLGPALGGVLGEIGTRAPFFGAAALALASVIFGYFALPESLTRANRRAFRWTRANPFGSAMTLLRYPVVWGLAGVVALYQIGHHVLPATWSFFTIERFAWSPLEIGASLAAVGTMMAIVQGTLIGRIVPKIGERASAYIGLGCGTLALCGYALAPWPWLIYVFLVPGALQGLSGAAIQSIMANEMPPDSQGELQGALGSIAGITSIVGPLVMTQTFGYFTSDAAPVYLPGAAFLLAALLTFAALGLLWSQVRNAAVDTHRTRH
jgi:DHA1 family tetracycline resistance protein-like MFS transporter